jgi:hypothetical protein
MNKKVQKMFKMAEMKSSNKECSWITTQAYALGHQVNDQNQRFIDLRKCQGNNRNAYVIYFIYCFSEGSSMNTVASPMNDPSSFNWNRLKVLLDADEYVAL